MIRPREDRCFHRYCRTGDPRLLAKVFDRTADELYAVAAHLCKNRNDAEDAVQTTFLVAIEQRDRWDASRPVLPWLLGILTNRVRQQRRAAGRPEPTALVRDDVEPDPHERAVDAEFRAACQAALSRVPEPYRETLERNLLHGHAPQQIARELGVGAGTVRMRLSRGLGELRRRLPTGFAGGAVAAMVLSASARAAMRARVLAAGGGLEGAAVGSSAGFLASIGVLLMKKSVVSVLALAVLAVGAYVAVADGANASGTASLPEAVVVSTTTTAIAPTASAAKSEPAASRTRAPAASAQDSYGRVRVVLRHGATKEPVAGVGIEAVLTEAIDPTSVGRVDHGRTDEQGIALVRLSAGKAAIKPQNPQVREPVAVVVRAGHETELVVDLPVQLHARVLVVDEHEAPVANARIVGRTFADVGDLVERELGRTDRDGRFAMEFLDASVSMRALADGCAASSPVDLHAREPEVTLVVTRGAAALTGTVRDADGRPMPSITVALQPVRDGEKGARPLAVVTDEHGVYHSAHVPPGNVIAIAMRREQNVQCTAMARTTCASGTQTRLDLRFGTGAELTVAVTGADGKPGADLPLALVFWPQREVWSHLAIYAQATTDARGFAVFADLVPGTHQVQLHGQAMKEQKVELAAGERKRIDWTLAPKTFVEVLVLDERNEPLRGWTVALLPEHGTIAQATTDADGLVRFADVPMATYRVAVGEPSAMTSVETAVRCGERTDVRVERAQRANAAVTGRLAASDTGLLVAARIEITTLPDRATIGLDPSADGSFRRERLVAGSYEIAVRHAETTAYLAQPKRISLHADETLDLGAIAIALPSKVTFEVRSAEGQRLREARSALALPDAPRTFYLGLQPLSWAELPHGRYEAMVFGEDGVPSLMPVVADGAEVEVPVTLLRGVPTTFRFDSGAGRGELALLQNGVELWKLALRDGAPCTIGLAAGRYEASFTDADGRGATAAFEVALGSPLEVALAPTK